MRWLALAFLMLATPAFAQTPVFIAPVKLNPLDIATITTGATAVVAIAPGNRTLGGWIRNPTSATVDLCVNEITTAAGTTSAGSLTCLAPGIKTDIAPSALGVSVVSSDSAHPFSGYGFSVPQ